MYKLADITVDITFVPYLYHTSKNISKKTGLYTNTTAKFTDEITKFVKEHKLQRFNEIVKNICRWLLNIKKYKFDTKDNLIHVTASLNQPMYSLDAKKKYSKKELKESIRKTLIDYYGHSKMIVGDAGPDSWMEGGIMLFDEGEYGDKMYELVITFNDVKYRFEK